jgi:mRNA-degrading endonuclease RelE of RelBE toxin-antitoxin system
MSYKIYITDNFKKDVKRLSKKYRSVKTDLNTLKKQLLENPCTGTSLGNDCYKIRLAVKSKGKGKSGGARVITLVKIINEEIHLLTVYDKSDKETITQIEIDTLLKEIGF